MKKILNRLTVDKYIVLIMFIVLGLLPLFSSTYTTHIFGKFLTYMILALSLDILWGYCGLMNLGFAVFFGIGGYITGLSLACQNGIPAFMTSGGITELPWFYKLIQHIPISIILSIVLPSLVALFLGYFIFTSKIKGVFFNLITLAFAAMFELLIKTNQAYTGGSSGINGIASGMKNLKLFGNKISISGWYYIAFISLLVIYFFCLFLTECRFGKVIKSIRDNEARLQFLGYNPAVFKLAVFAISGAIAGYAGALYVPMTSFMSVESAGISFSTMILVWIAVGGKGNLAGSMFGTLFVCVLQSKLSSGLGDMWQLILGIVLILVVMFLPKGIIGTILDKEYNRKTNKMLNEVREKGSSV